MDWLSGQTRGSPFALLEDEVTCFLSPVSGWLSICMKHNERRSYCLHLVGFKPHRFLTRRPFQSDEIETERFLEISSNHIDGVDGSSESPKGTVTGHLYSAAYLQDGCHAPLNTFPVGPGSTVGQPTWAATVIADTSPLFSSSPSLYFMEASIPQLAHTRVTKTRDEITVLSHTAFGKRLMGSAT